MNKLDPPLFCLAIGRLAEGGRPRATLYSSMVIFGLLVADGTPIETAFCLVALSCRTFSMNDFGLVLSSVVFRFVCGFSSSFPSLLKGRFLPAVTFSSSELESELLLVLLLFDLMRGALILTGPLLTGTFDFLEGTNSLSNMFWGTEVVLYLCLK